MMTDPPRAACLTAPAAGGIAVVQVVGATATRLLVTALKSRRPLDLERMDNSELRLCRLVDGDETIDDVLVCVRHPADAVAIVDLSIHGGPRIVQRVLLLLKRLGTHIVEAGELASVSWPATNAVEQEVLATLPQAKTRTVACWLALMKDDLPTEIERIIDQIRTDQIDVARMALKTLFNQREQARYLLEGVRAVLIGEPNTGKSTLANALAQCEHAIVSATPGTTRDWVEHPAAVTGVPVTFVDTAGIRKTQDLIEQEAVRRTHDQVKSADIVLRVMDASVPPTAGDQDALADAFDGQAIETLKPRRLFVWNKSDRPVHPAQQRYLDPLGEGALLVSAQTGDQLDALRHRLLEMVGLGGHTENIRAPFSCRQVDACAQALSVLGGAEPDADRAVGRLRFLIDATSPTGRRPDHGL